MVEGEEQEHRVVSRINLVDLAGSERCSKTQASEDRLKVKCLGGAALIIVISEM